MLFSRSAIVLAVFRRIRLHKHFNRELEHSMNDVYDVYYRVADSMMFITGWRTQFIGALIE